jgi:hypothetical protein
MVATDCNEGHRGVHEDVVIRGCERGRERDSGIKRGGPALLPKYRQLILCMLRYSVTTGLSSDARLALMP